MVFAAWYRTTPASLFRGQISRMSLTAGLYETSRWEKALQPRGRGALAEASGQLFRARAASSTAFATAGFGVAGLIAAQAPIHPGGDTAWAPDPRSTPLAFAALMATVWVSDTLVMCLSKARRGTSNAKQKSRTERGG